MKKKVLIITYYWPPSGGAGVQRWLKFVKYLRNFGWEPIILTVDEKRASYGLIDKSLEKDIPENIKIIKTSTFEPYSLYKILTRKKEIPHSGFANESNPGFIQKFSRAIRGNLFIPDPRKGWNNYAYKAAKKIIKDENINTIITTSPPHSTQLIGLKLKNKLKINWIADIRDPWVDIYYSNNLYRLPFAKNQDEKYEKMVLKNADKITVVGDFIKNNFLQKNYFSNTSKIYVLPNGYDQTDFDSNNIISENKFTITYTGTIADTYDLNAFINAFSNFTNNKPKNKIVLKLIGKISDEILGKIHKKNLSEYTEVIKYAKHTEAIKYIKNSTLLLLAIPKIKDNNGIITGKIFEYLASQKPIIGIGPLQGDAAKILSECHAGKIFDYNSEKEILDELNKYYKNWIKGEDLSIKNNIYKKYSREEITKSLIKIIIK